MTDTTTTSPQQAIENLAPWPTPTPTADALAQHLTVQAFAAHCRLHNHPCWQTPKTYDGSGHPTGAYASALAGYHRDTELAWALYSAAYLMRESAGPNTLPADRLAAELVRGEDAAEYAADTLTDWLDEYGIDPEVVVQAVRAERGLP